MKTQISFQDTDMSEKFLVNKYEIAKMKFVKTIEKVIRKSEKMMNSKQ